MSERTEQLTSMLDGLNTDDLLALQAALDERLAEARNKVIAQAQALNMKCVPNGALPKKGRGRSTKHDTD